MVSNFDGENQLEIIRAGLERPTGLAVHPKKGFVFWADGGSEPQIARAGMDGGERKVLVGSSHGQLLSPAGLTLDLLTDRIFWADGGLQTISSARLDGSGVVEVLSLRLRRPHLSPASLSVAEDWLYWTEAGAGQSELYKANKFDGSGLVRLDQAGQLRQTKTSVRAFHALLQPAWKNYCQIREQKCSHVCVPSLDMSEQSHTRVGTVCLCPPELKLSDDNFTCHGNSAPSSQVSSKVILDQEIEAQKNSQKKENRIIIIIIGLIGGSLFLVFLVSVISIDYHPKS